MKKLSQILAEEGLSKTADEYSETLSLIKKADDSVQRARYSSSNLSIPVGVSQELGQAAKALQRAEQLVLRARHKK